MTRPWLGVLVLAIAAAARPAPAGAEPLAIAGGRTVRGRAVDDLDAMLVVGSTGTLGGPGGYSARLDEQQLHPLVTRGAARLSIGADFGLEVWRAGPDDWGGSLPLTLALDLRVGAGHAALGAGFDYLLVDQVADDTGLGLFAPLGFARVGVEVAGVELGADGRFGYRWQLGAPDYARWQLGLYVGRTFALR